MIPTYSWLKPKILGELQLNKIIYVSLNTLYSDENLKTIWINLEEKNFSLNFLSGPFKFGIVRDEIKSSQDFSFLPISFNDINSKSKIINLLSDLGFWNFFSNQDKNILNFSIIEKYNFIQNLVLNIDKAKTSGENISLPLDILEKISFSENDLKVLENLSILSKNLQKISINELCSNKKYSLLVGVLNLEKSMRNKVATEKNNISKLPKSFNSKKFSSYFDEVILNQEIKNKVYFGMGLNHIINLERPKTGGVILIDHGGTGKSLLKKSFKNLFEDLGSEVKEKTQGDITSYINSGPQVIKKWYRGGPADEVTGPFEEDLVAKAKENGVPSLLIIDEAEEFIRDRKDSSKDPVNALNTLKRYIQDSNKGGVTGYVLTLLIANIDIDEIHTPLQQGAERLTVVYLGPPNTIKIWEKVIDNCFFDQNKLNFENNFNKNILAILLFEHQNLVSHEKYAITPRKLAAYASEYYSKHTVDEIKINSNDKRTFDEMFDLNKNKKLWKINFDDFLKNIISELLIDELNKDSNLKKSPNEIINIYKNLISKFNQNNIIEAEVIKNSSNLSTKDQKIIENIEKTFIWINSNFKTLGLMYMKKYPKDLNIEKLNTQFNNSLNYLFQNIEVYYKFKKLDTGMLGGKLRNMKKMISNSILIMNNWKTNGYITPTEYSTLTKYLLEIIERKSK